MPSSLSSRYWQADELELPGVPVDREPALVDRDAHGTDVLAVLCPITARGDVGVLAVAVLADDQHP